jgi:AraC-like DNA-binding protein
VISLPNAADPLVLAATDVLVSRVEHEIARDEGCAVVLAALFPAGAERFASLLAALPNTIVLRGGAGEALAEAPSGSASIEPPWAGEASLGARARYALLAALRASVAALPLGEQRALAALGDAQIGAAVGTLLRRPQDPQSVARLARASHMSRSAFAARFTAAVGLPPLRFQLERRMRCASALLRESAIGLKAIADAIGYRSMPSFSHAFKRWAGIAPGEFRRGGRPCGSIAVLAAPREAERSRGAALP